MDTIDRLYQKGVSRRNFLVAAGAAGAVAALAGCNDPGTITPTSTLNSLQDSDILTFALNLEYIEAEYYLYAATGTGLSAADAGSGAGTTIVPATTKLTGLTTGQQNTLNEIAYDEQTHVQFLRSALGSAAVARPAIDLTFFAPLYVAAQTNAGITTGQVTNFSPFTSFDNFLLGAFIFEDVGVTAYSGAAPLISAAGVKAGYLLAAAGILAVEAYHAGYVRTILTGNAINSPGATAGTTTYSQFNSAVLVQKLRAALSGGTGETLLTIPTSTTAPSTVVNASASTAQGYARTPDQVLHIVYGAATPGTAKGGFLPNGANYRFATTTT